MQCPVCGKEIGSNINCEQCGFDDIRTNFQTSTEREHWMKTVVQAYAFDYIFKSMMPSEAEIMKKRLGLFDGRVYSREEVAKERDVCVHRIMQIEAKGLRKIQRLWYFENNKL